MTRTELVEAVKAYAVEHYVDGGWDVVVECWTDEQIGEHIGRARTLAGALRKFATLVDVWADREADARNAAGEGPGAGPAPFVTELCHAGRHDQCRGHVAGGSCECPAEHPARPVEPAPAPAPVHGATPATYSPAGLTRDGWSPGASPYLGGCDTIAMGALSHRVWRSFTVAVQFGRIHVWADHGWQGHTRSVPAVAEWLTAHGATGVQRIEAAMVDAMRAAGTLGRYVTWTADGAARFGWLRPTEGRYRIGTLLATCTGNGVQQIITGPWTCLAEPGALVDVEPGAACRPGCDQLAATVVADPRVGAVAVCTGHTGWSTPAAYLPALLPTVADVLGAPAEVTDVNAVELRDRRTIAHRIGISEDLYAEIDNAVNWTDSPPAGGYVILSSAEAARELYPVESAVLAWVHDMVWRQHRPVTLGGLRDQLAQLRAQAQQAAAKHEAAADEDARAAAQLPAELAALSPAARAALGNVIDWPGTPHGVILSGNMHPATREAMMARGLIERTSVPGDASAYPLTQHGRDILDALAAGTCAHCDAPAVTRGPDPEAMDHDGAGRPPLDLCKRHAGPRLIAAPASAPAGAEAGGLSVVVSADFAAYASGELPADLIRCVLCGHAPCDCPPFGTPAYLALVDRVHGRPPAAPDRL